MKKSIPFSIILLFTFLFFQISMYGQGAWVEQLTGTGDVSNQFLEGGDDCIGYAKKNSQYIWFFDVNAHKWTTVDLGSEQVFQRMEAKGHVIMAYTDDYIVGYSSITSGYDTLRYTGIPLYPNTDDLVHRSYGCIDRAAYFVTYLYFYVFDGELGKWQKYLYPSHPYDDGAVIFLQGDEYIGMIIPDHNDPYNIVTNMAYSLTQHDAASTDNAGYPNYPDIKMTHGFATWLFPEGKNIVLLTGYCSATNHFSHNTNTIHANSFNFHPGIWSYPDIKTENNVMVFVKDSLYADGYEHEIFYAFYTVDGRWDTDYDAFVFKPSDESGYRFFSLGSSIAMANSRNWETGESSYYLYNGISGVFNQVDFDGLDYDNGDPSPNCVNNIVLAYDTTKVWIYNPTHLDAHIANGYFDNTTNYIIGDHFIAVNMWNPLKGLSKDKVHIYNTSLNKATTIEMDSYHASFYPLVSNEMFAFVLPNSNDREVYFYSGITDSLSHAAFTPGNQIKYLEVKDQIGVAYSTNGTETFLFDANTNAMTLYTESFSSSKPGGNYIMLHKDETMKVYNFTKQEFSEIQLDNMGNFWTGDTIGLVSDTWKNNYSAYNGYTNSWIPLAAEGHWTYNTQAFNKTAVVVRKDRLYAFDPFIASGIDEENITSDNTFKLLQNRPNPFTGNTEISYALTKAGQVSLNVYDLYGKQVAMLVDEYQHAGDYQVSYAPAGLPDGIYYYTLTFNNTSRTKKMMVVK